MALIGNVRKATSEGKSGPVETGLTGPAATALLCLELRMGLGAMMFLITRLEFQKIMLMTSYATFIPWPHTHISK